MNTLLASLYVGKLSRDSFPKVQRKGQLVDPDWATVPWNTFENLKKAFVARHPELKSKLNKYLAAEAEKWGELFGDAFRKHSFLVFVVDNVPAKEYYY